MNREEFMTRLKALLADISEEEREEALQYYYDYFEDAGKEHEAEVIRELESPEKVAATIQADLKNEEPKEDGKTGYKMVKPVTYEKEKKKMSGGQIALIVVLSVFAAPIALPLLFAAVMVVFSLLIAAFSVFAALVISAIAVCVAGVVSVVRGVSMLTIAVPTGIFTIGAGLLMGVVGAVAVVGAVKLCTIVYPMICRFVKTQWKKIKMRRKKQDA